MKREPIYGFLAANNLCDCFWLRHIRHFQKCSEEQIHHNQFGKFTEPLWIRSEFLADRPPQQQFWSIIEEPSMYGIPPYKPAVFGEHGETGDALMALYFIQQFAPPLLSASGGTGPIPRVDIGEHCFLGRTFHGALATAVLHFETTSCPLRIYHDQVLPFVGLRLTLERELIAVMQAADPVPSGRHGHHRGWQLRQEKARRRFKQQGLEARRAAFAAEHPDLSGKQLVSEWNRLNPNDEISEEQMRKAVSRHGKPRKKRGASRKKKL